MKIQPVYIDAVNIPDAWFQCLYALSDYGFKYPVEQGSFVGETRVEFDWISVQITHPYSEPYDNMLPVIPAGLGIPNPVAPGYIDMYLPYLMTEEKQETEDYTYGSRLWPQIEPLISRLKQTPGTNQSILQVGQPNDFLLSDPPCLRHIDMRVRDNNLIFYPYFRSWDLWAGFPANLAAIAVLQKYIADALGVDVGPMLASSKGLHVYGYAEELMKLRTGRQNGGDCDPDYDSELDDWISEDKEVKE